MGTNRLLVVSISTGRGVGGLLGTSLAATLKEAARRWKAFRWTTLR